MLIDLFSRREKRNALKIYVHEYKRNPAIRKNESIDKKVSTTALIDTCESKMKTRTIDKTDITIVPNVLDFIIVPSGNP